MVGKTREDIAVNLDLISGLFLGKLAKASEKLRVFQARTIATQRKVEMQAKRLRVAQDALAKRQQFFAQWSDKLGVNTGRVGKIMQHQGIIFDKMGNITDHAGRSINNLNGQMKKGEAATRGFKMQWLGVMFAGMAIQRIFGGLLRTQFQLFGITDMFSSMWTIVLLPVMEALLPIMMRFAEFMMDLPDSTKLWIGRLIVAAAIFGTFLAVVGAVALAVNSISEVIADLIPLDALNDMSIFGVSLGNLFGSFEKLAVKGGVLMGLLGLFGLTVKGVAAATDDNSESQEGFMDKINKVMSKATGWVKGLGEMFVKIGGKTQTVIDKIIGFVSELGLSVEDVGKDISSAMGVAWGNSELIIGASMTWIEGRIMFGFETVWKWLRSKMPDWMVEAIEGAWDSMVTWLEDIKNSKSLGDAIFATVRLINNWGEIGRYIAGEMMSGIIDNLTKKITSNKFIKRISKFAFYQGLGGGLLGSFQNGGIIPQTGPYLLHQGETVIPAGQTNNNISPTINISARISSDYDVRRLADQLKLYWTQDFERVSQGRTI